MKHMLIKLSPDIDSLTVSADGLESTTILGFAEQQPKPVEVATLDKPVLLTDVHKINQLPSNVRDAVFALYQSYPRTVEYDGVSVSWSPTNYPRVWCPSIDTIFLARGLKPYLGEITSAAEIGTGSGFIIKYILTHAPKLESGVASDINIEAVRCATDALSDEPDRHKISFVLPDSNSSSLELSGKFDLIVTNPPYIPRPGANIDNPYEGLNLVYQLSQEAKDMLNPGGQIIMNLSSLAGDEPLSWFTDNGWNVEALETMRVPLKVNNVTSGVSEESQRWLKYLETKGNLEIDEGESDGYRFWHTLRLYRITQA